MKMLLALPPLAGMVIVLAPRRWWRYVLWGLESLAILVYLVAAFGTLPLAAALFGQSGDAACLRGRRRRAGKGPELAYKPRNGEGRPFGRAEST